MRMYLHFGYGDTLLFEQLHVNSAFKMLFACFVLFLASVMIEAIAYLRTLRCTCDLAPLRLTKGGKQQQQQLQTPEDAESDNMSAYECENGEQMDSGGSAKVSTECQKTSSHKRQRNAENTAAAAAAAEDTCGCASHFDCDRCAFDTSNIKFRLVHTVLQLVRCGLVYTLMLAAMTYNVCLLFAIIAGAGFGFFIFYRPDALASGGVGASFCG